MQLTEIAKKLGIGYFETLDFAEKNIDIIRDIDGRDKLLCIAKHEWPDRYAEELIQRWFFATLRPYPAARRPFQRTEGEPPPVASYVSGPGPEDLARQRAAEAAAELVRAEERKKQREEERALFLKQKAAELDELESERRRVEAGAVARMTRLPKVEFGRKFNLDA